MINQLVGAFTEEKLLCKYIPTKVAPDVWLLLCHLIGYSQELTGTY